MNISALMNMYSAFKQNPERLFQQYNIPTQYINDPQGAIQYLMNNGKITQQQYNNANNLYKQLQNNPMFMQQFKK